MIKTVLFDLDGTLLDTAQDLAYALNRVREEQGLPDLAFDQIRPVVSHGGNALIKAGFDLEESDQRFEGLRQRLLAIYQENIARQTRLFPGMQQVLRHIEDNGQRWGVVTNKPSWLTDPLMAALELTERSACIVSGDTTAQRKPHPEPLLHACRISGSRVQDCLYVGDAQRDITAGKQAGMLTLAARYGYIEANDDVQAWGADGTVDSPLDILSWIKPSDKQSRL